jgi:uncharacterized protein YutE (UPF0331/DUF86 family)
MEAINSREKQRARAIAEEYRSQGYEVIEEPSPEQLPDFLSGYHLDLFIRKGDEARIVEVKSKSSLAKDPRIRDLARLLHNKPNWNFELVVVGEDTPFGSLEEARPFKKEDILQGIEATEKLLESGFNEAALMSAWSTAEATIRLLIEAEGLSLDRFDPPFILMQAVTNGLISREDYNFLTKVIKHRNALAHGFKTIDFDPALVKELVSTTKRLSQSTTASLSGEAVEV